MTKEAAATTDAYRVLARKYRPQRFDALIGQENLVRTLGNALQMGRLAHAFILTGLRGIGKTTTARLLARGLNCTGTDGSGGPTLAPCGVCSTCSGIAEGKHIDVIEMDAASHTGVDDIREIIDGVSYRPLEARYKIYIIDEVHMLSKNAFNALLKTLEEPPQSVKFIFATTEIRKVPVTVLSRCQRFDLRRIPTAMMAEHLARIAEAESISLEAAAAQRLARAAEGSVRDGLSLLDQAAALTGDDITDTAVSSMLGQAGRGAALELLATALGGATADALHQLDGIIASGAEPLMIISDLLEFIHLASRMASGGTAGDLPEAEQQALASLLEHATMPRLVRSWQILLKGHAEVAVAPQPAAAAAMIVIRLAHAAPMPTPDQLVRQINAGTTGGAPVRQQTTTSAGPAARAEAQPHSAPAVASVMPLAAVDAAGQGTADPSEEAADRLAELPVVVAGTTSGFITASNDDSRPARKTNADDTAATADATEVGTIGTTTGPTAEPEPPAETDPVPTSIASPTDWRAVARLFEDQGEMILATKIRSAMRPLRFEEGHIRLALDKPGDETLPPRIAGLLDRWTGIRWLVTVESGNATVPTLDEEDTAQRQAEIAAVSADPLVAASLAAFPGAQVTAVASLQTAAPESPDAATDEPETAMEMRGHA